MRAFFIQAAAVWRRRRLAGLALAAMMSVYFFSYFLRTAVPGTIFDEIQTDMDMTASAVAGLGSVFLGIYAWSQLFVGMAADRFGGRRTLLCGGAVMVAGAIGFPLSRNVLALFATRVLTGFGASFMYLSLVHEVETLFGARRFPAVLGLVLFSGYAGGIAATLPFARLSAWLGWRPALLAVAAALAVCWLVAWAVLRRLPREPRPDAHRTGTLRGFVEIVMARRNRYVLLGGLLNFPVYFLVQNVVGKKFLQDVAGLSSSRAAGFVLVMAAVTAVSASMSGVWMRLADHRRLAVIRVFLWVLAAGTLLLTAGAWFRAPVPVFLLAYVLLAASVASGSAWAALIKEMNGRAYVAQSVAVLNGAIYLGVAVLSWLAGLVLDRFAGRSVLTEAGRLYPPEAYGALFAGMSAIVALSFFCLRRIPETWTGTAFSPLPQTLEPEKP